MGAQRSRFRRQFQRLNHDHLAEGGQLHVSGDRIIQIVGTKDSDDLLTRFRAAPRV